jgi:polysaccharide pyruvyl transferase WcaK-like protein
VVAERLSAPATTVRPGVDDVVGEVARGRVVVAMRYHSLVSAVLGGRPALSLGYDPKVDALAGDVGPGVISLGCDRTAVAALPAAVEQLATADHHLGERAVVDAQGRLRERERRNGAALERLLAR